MDRLLPAIRQACILFADDIAVARMVDSDAYTIAFRPKIRAFISVTGPYLEALRDDPARAVEGIRIRMEQVKSACEYAINEVFDKPQEDIKIEFSLGAEPPQSTI
jgi:hypothetical protein